MLFRSWLSKVALISNPDLLFDIIFSCVCVMSLMDTLFIQKVFVLIYLWLQRKYYKYIVTINNGGVIMAYSREVVERFENVLANPEAYAVGEFDPKDATVATGMVGAPACGDVMKLDLKINEKDVIQRSEERRVGKECRSWWSPYH